MSPSPWQMSLQQWIAQHNRPPRIAVLGIGNSLRSDDAAGVLVARRLAQSRLTRDFDSILVVDAGPAPENTTAGLRRFAPELVLLIDAAEMGELPGMIREIGIHEIDGLSASTHSLPLSMLAKYLILELGCEVKILGIQPQSIEIGNSVSDDVLLAVGEITAGLLESLPEILTLEPDSLN
jgi:hydrogenase 3 maturation protease